MAQPTIGAQASRLARDLTLNSPSATKTTIPKLVYGTAWKKDRTEDLVYKALKTGFRGIDTAAQPKHYDEEAVGKGVRRAVAEGLVKREDLFIQTKFTSPRGQNNITPYDLNAPLPEKVQQSIQSSLRHFTVKDGEAPYLDSVVMHSPLDTLQDTLTAWTTLQTYTPHTIRNLGISNVDFDTLRALQDSPTTTIKPAVVQNRFHEGTDFEPDLRAFCRSNSIVFQSFWTLSANPRLVKSPPVRNVAQEAGVTVPAAYYSLVLGLEGITVLDGTTNEDHMREDLEGIEKVGLWAEGEGTSGWETALKAFKTLIAEPQ